MHESVESKVASPAIPLRLAREMCGEIFEIFNIILNDSSYIGELSGRD